jgi:outer membrane protein OmpA-like peptidoglycan-associated protein
VGLYIPSGVTPVLAGLRAQCQSGDPDGTLGQVYGQIPGSSSCAAGQVAVGIVGRESDFLANFAVRCRAADLTGGVITAGGVGTGGNPDGPYDCADSEHLVGLDGSLNELNDAMQQLTLTARQIVVIKRTTRSITATCALDQPRLQQCRATLTGGRRTLATGQASAGPDGARATIRLALSARARRLARRPGGQNATLTATATQISGPQLQATIPLLLLPSAVVSAPTDGLFATGSAKLPTNGTPYLRELRELITGARRITCTGHTDNRGGTRANQALGLARARAVCSFLTRDTRIKTRVQSRGETHPRAPNTTAKGRALNRYVSIEVRY